MTDNQKEFRIARGSNVPEYVRKFSATEKAIFSVLVILAIVTALIMVIQLSNSLKAEIPAHGGTLHEGIVGLPRTINPVLAITDVDHDLSALIYSGLMKYKNDRLSNDLADSYTVSADGLTYDFKLRPDTHFQDGIVLTADDIAFTIQKIQDPALKSPRRSDWTNVTANVVSPNEIQFVLKQPYAPFLANTTMGILPKHIWGNVNNDQFIFSQYNIQPVGSGPYKVGAISRDAGGIPTEYRLTTWNGYYGREPFLSNLAFDFFADQEKALSALDSGEIGSLAAISPAAALRLASDTAEGYTVLSSPLPRVFGIFLNQGQSPLLADKTVRQALDLAVDRDAIIKKVLSGYGTAITGPLPPGMITGATPTDDQSSSALSGTVSAIASAFSKNTGTSSDAHVATAQALLEKNGWKKDTSGIYSKKSTKTATTTLSIELYTADSDDLKQAVDIVKKSWTDLGVRVTVRILDASDLYQNVIRPRKFDALLFGQQIGKDRDLYAFWHSSQRTAPGLNVSMYTNSKVDKVLEDIRSSNDEKTRTADYIQLSDIIKTDIPAIFLYSPDFIYVVPKNLKGITLDSVTIPSDRWNSIADWYVNTEKVWKIFTK